MRMTGHALIIKMTHAYSEKNIRVLLSGVVPKTFRLQVRLPLGFRKSDETLILVFGILHKNWN